MRLFYKGKDGGPDSPVTGYFLIEIKWLFSIVLLKFNEGTRENFHNHAFNAFTWFIKGCLLEEIKTADSYIYKAYRRSINPKLTKKDRLHRVHALETSYCISVRGPWSKTWQEYSSNTREYTTLSSPGRKEVK